MIRSRFFCISNSDFVPGQRHLFQTEQQVSCSAERGPLCAYGSGDDVTAISQLVAALDDERQGVMVVGGQLVAVQDRHLGAGHLLLSHEHTHTHTHIHTHTHTHTHT